MRRSPEYLIRVPAEHQDAELVALCNQAVALHRKAVAAFNKSVRENDGVAKWEDPDPGAWHRLCDQITLKPAITREGMLAKAEVLAVVVALQEPLVASLVSDMIGRNVGDMTARGRRRLRRAA